MECVCVCACVRVCCDMMLCVLCMHVCMHVWYRIAGNFGRKNIWRIALIMAFGGFYFGGWGTLYHNYIHSKMVTYVTDWNGSSVNTAESVSNHSTLNEAGTS